MTEMFYMSIHNRNLFLHQKSQTEPSFLMAFLKSDISHMFGIGYQSVSNDSVQSEETPGCNVSPATQFSFSFYKIDGA